ncbi:unnamed protein product, partial [Closterium sp. Naga37s-1]
PSHAIPWPATGARTGREEESINASPDRLEASPTFNQIANAAASSNDTSSRRNWDGEIAGARGRHADGSGDGGRSKRGGGGNGSSRSRNVGRLGVGEGGVEGGDQEKQGQLRYVSDSLPGSDCHRPIGRAALAIRSCFGRTSGVWEW